MPIIHIFNQTHSYKFFHQQTAQKPSLIKAIKIGQILSADIFHSIIINENYINSMIVISWIILTLTLSSTTFAAITTILNNQSISTPLDHNKFTISITQSLLNYIGCKVWLNNLCVQCSFNYYFNDNGVCCEINPQCRTFNRAMGICQQCYNGYSIYSGTCILQDIAQFKDLGCKQFNKSTFQCVQCSNRWYYNEQQNICNQIDGLCRKWNSVTGECTQCYIGYTLINNGSCALKNSNQKQLGISDLFCAQYNIQNGKCLSCSERAYRGPIGICIPVSVYCRTWDQNDGLCLSCYRGYFIVDGQCSLQQLNTDNIDSQIGCRIYNWLTSTCVQCSYRWYLKIDYCIAVSQLCRAYETQTGGCLSCYQGYRLTQDKQCKQQQPSKLQGCRLWNIDNNQCIQCSQRWYFEYQQKNSSLIQSLKKQKICTPISDLCKQYNLQTGSCTQCYYGFKLIQQSGKCIVYHNLPNTTEIDGCKIYNQQTNICEQCSYKCYYNQQRLKCVQVDPLCKQNDEIGHCISCFNGYQLNLQEGMCRIVQNDNCAVRNQNTNQCMQCYLGYIVQDKQCRASDPLCRLTDQSGNCTSCFNTYVLYHNKCVPLSRMVSLAHYYASCCPDLLEQLKREGRIQ